MSVFCLSIEETEGKSFMYGFHLGTDERLAREIAVEKYNARVAHGLPVVTVALIRNRQIVDVFCGDKWMSELNNA